MAPCACSHCVVLCVFVCGIWGGGGRGKESGLGRWRLCETASAAPACLWSLTPQHNGCLGQVYIQVLLSNWVSDWAVSCLSSVTCVGQLLQPSPQHTRVRHDSTKVKRFTHMCVPHGQGCHHVRADKSAHGCLLASHGSHRGSR